MKIKLKIKKGKKTGNEKKKTTQNKTRSKPTKSAQTNPLFIHKAYTVQVHGRKARAAGEGCMYRARRRDEPEKKQGGGATGGPSPLPGQTRTRGSGDRRRRAGCGPEGAAGGGGATKEEEGRRGATPPGFASSVCGQPGTASPSSSPSPGKKRGRACRDGVLPGGSPL